MTAVDTATTVLEVDGLSKHFGGVKAVDEVSLSLRLGEALGLIGPNGSGKTTFVNCITGYLAPTRGEVRVDGTDVTRWAPHRLAQRGVGRTYQVPRLFPTLTVAQNVEAALTFVRRQPRIIEAFLPARGDGPKELRRRAMELLDTVGVADLADRSASGLSLGESRRVEIARSLAAAQRILILDEPVAGLRGEEAMAVGALIAGTARDRNLGVIVIEHNVALIRTFCSRLMVLNLGRLIAGGAPEDVVRDPVVVEAYIGRDDDGDGR
jgi:ABC-type branched-subunit amino acid transport system ATPase component